MTNKSDDGSQTWFDAQLRMRAQQRHNPNKSSQNPLDRRVVAPHQQQDPTVKEAEIHDPYIRDLVAKRAQQPHFGPIPLDKEVNTSTDIDGLRRQQQMLQQTSGVNPLGDADLSMIFNKGQQPQPMQQPQHHQQGGGAQQVVLREGYPVYRAMQQAFGNTFIIAREVGVVNQQLASQQFLMKGMIQAYVVPPHQQQVNIQEIQRNPHLLSALVEVHAPPMASLGPLLVPREAVLTPGPYGNRQMITDARQHPNTNQPYYPSNPNARGILKG